MTAHLLNRRTWLGAGAAAATAFGQAAPRYAYVGSFTTALRLARGNGINVYRVDTASGVWTHIQHLGDLVNPSFLILSADQRFLYSVHADESYATSFAVDKQTGRLTKLNQAKTGGPNGVHQAIDPSGRFMLVANYANGTIAVMPIRPDGSLADYSQLYQLQGPPGTHRIEQTGSHPHQVMLDPARRFVIVPDKGIDRVFVLRFDPAAGELKPHSEAITRAGAGPRHIAFHSRIPFAWVMNELDNTVGAYRWDAQAGTLKAVQILPSLPPDYTDNDTASGIVVSPNGRYLYCSNRGHDSIATFAIDAKSGLLTSRGWTPTQGKVPRFIGFDSTSRFLHAANEQGDTILMFGADRASGKLTPVGNPVKNSSPATIAFTS